MKPLSFSVTLCLREAGKRGRVVTGGGGNRGSLIPLDVVHWHCGTGSQGPFFCTASTSRVTELLQVGHTVKVHEGSCHHQDMEQLVRVKPNITFARKKSLRNTCGIKAGPSDVKSSHEEEPAHLAHSGCPEEALSDHKVQGRNYSTQPQTNKHASSYSSVLWRSKEVTLRDCNGCQAQDTHYYKVDEAGLRGTVEGVVEPWDKTAHDQESYTRVVQL